MNTPMTPRSIVTLKLPRQVPVLISVAKGIVQAFTGNASLPNPDPTLAAVNAAIADLETAQTEAQSRTKGAVETRNQKRAVLEALILRLKVFVQKVADADREHAPAIIQSAAMNVRKVAGRKKRTFGAKQGNVSGSVGLETASAGHRAYYEWEVSADGGKTWQLASSTTQTKTTVTGLQPGATYSFRCRPVTKVGAGDWTQPVSWIVR
jgi:hypothetical protein